MRNESNFQSIWEYEVKDGYRAEFIEAYCAEGSWVRFFAKCQGYVRTELKQDVERSNRFLTIDYWRSRSEFEAMIQTPGDEYDQLDKQCEFFTLSEKHLGFFSNEATQAHSH